VRERLNRPLYIGRGAQSAQSLSIDDVATGKHFLHTVTRYCCAWSASTLTTAGLCNISFACAPKAGKRLYDVHIKDLADMMVKESQVAVGEGKMPVRGIFEALMAVGYKGFVDLEYEIHEDDPLPGMMKSFAFMRKVLAEMK